MEGFALREGVVDTFNFYPTAEMCVANIVKIAARKLEKWISEPVPPIDEQRPQKRCKTKASSSIKRGSMDAIAENRPLMVYDPEGPVVKYLTQTIPLVKVEIPNATEAAAGKRLVLNNRSDAKFQIPKYVLEGSLPLGWKITLMDTKVKLAVHYLDDSQDSSAGPWRFYYLMDPSIGKAVQKALGRNTVPKKDIHPDSFLCSEASFTHLPEDIENVQACPLTEYWICQCDSNPKTKKMTVKVTLETTFQQSLKEAKVAHMERKIRRKQQQLRVLEQRCEGLKEGYAEGEGMKFPSSSAYQGPNDREASTSSSDAE
ncbi:unnamed protein product [Symbiodinium sp. CCMP2592]|nr:unnamed protein product [Symbiodinium sp. CCMP2592]